MRGAWRFLSVGGGLSSLMLGKKGLKRKSTVDTKSGVTRQVDAHYDREAWCRVVKKMHS